jgi:hypothetical protein
MDSPNQPMQTGEHHTAIMLNHIAATSINSVEPVQALPRLHEAVRRVARVSSNRWAKPPFCAGAIAAAANKQNDVTTMEEYR